MAKNVQIIENLKIEGAICFATKCHKGQVRKGSTIPYIFHPLEVMQLLAGMKADADLIVAGLLHDVLEDTEVGIEEIRNEFGEEVACLVGYHTEDKSKTWQERKNHAIEEALHANVRLKKLILADKLANMRSIHKDYHEIGDQLWSRFNAGKEKQEWYYGKMVESLAALQENEEASGYYKEFKKLYEEVFG